MKCQPREENLTKCEKSYKDFDFFFPPLHIIAFEEMFGKEQFMSLMYKSFQSQEKFNLEHKKR